MGLQPVHLTYDSGLSDPKHKGLLKTVSQGTGSKLRKYEFSYDTKGNLQSVQGPLAKSVSFTTDDAGRTTSKTFPDGEKVRVAYDANGHLATLAQPGTAPVYSGAEVHNFSSESRDLLQSYTAPFIGLPSDTTSYGYSLDKELELVTRPDALTVDPSYDAAGKLDQLLVPTDTISFTYKSKDDAVSPGKLSSILRQPAAPQSVVATGFTYAGRLLTSTSWSGAVSGSLSLSYDDDLRVVSETVAGSGAVNYSYGDADGLLTQAGLLSISLDPATAMLTGTSIGSLSDTVSYNAFAEPTSYVLTETAAPIYKIELSYDTLGRIVTKTETIGAGDVTGYEYQYDNAGRLYKVQQAAGDCSQIVCPVVAEYLYDANGNRTSVTEGGPAQTATYDAQDRLLSFGSTSYSYTDAGELSTKTDSGGTTTYSYDVLGQLRQVVLPNLDSIEYLIDGLGRRVGKKVNGVLERAWLYGGAPGPIAELGADGSSIEARFIYATKAHVPDYMVKGSIVYRLVTDQLGSVRMVVDMGMGNVMQRIDYDAWGKPTLVAGTWDFQPFGFAGGLYDPDTGLVRFGARDYDGESGRWTTKDPTRFKGATANLYSYGFLDPVNHFDPEGDFAITSLGILGVGAFAALVTTAAIQVLGNDQSGSAFSRSVGLVTGAINDVTIAASVANGIALAAVLGAAGTKPVLLPPDYFSQCGFGGYRHSIQECCRQLCAAKVPVMNAVVCLEKPIEELVDDCAKSCINGIAGIY